MLHCPPPDIWDKPMDEVSIAPTYKITSFSDQLFASTQTPAIYHPTSNAYTASLQATITQLQIKKSNYESKQQELQAQINSLQISVSSLTTAYTLTPTKPPSSIKPHTQLPYEISINY